MANIGHQCQEAAGALQPFREPMAGFSLDGQDLVRFISASHPCAEPRDRTIGLSPTRFRRMLATMPSTGLLSRRRTYLQSSSCLVGSTGIENRPCIDAVPLGVILETGPKQMAASISALRTYTRLSHRKPAKNQSAEANQTKWAHGVSGYT